MKYIKIDFKKLKFKKWQEGEQAIVKLSDKYTASIVRGVDHCSNGHVLGI